MNVTDQISTSRLSPHLHFGEVSSRQIRHAVHKRGARRRTTEAVLHAEGYLRQLGWREFAHHTLYHFPHTSDAPLRAEFAFFPWHMDVQHDMALR